MAGRPLRRARMNAEQARQNGDRRRRTKGTLRDFRTFLRPDRMNGPAEWVAAFELSLDYSMYVAGGAARNSIPGANREEPDYTHWEVRLLHRHEEISPHLWPDVLIQSWVAWFGGRTVNPYSEDIAPVMPTERVQKMVDALEGHRYNYGGTTEKRWQRAFRALGEEARRQERLRKETQEARDRKERQEAREAQAEAERTRRATKAREEEDGTEFARDVRARREQQRVEAEAFRVRVEAQRDQDFQRVRAQAGKPVYPIYTKAKVERFLSFCDMVRAGTTPNERNSARTQLLRMADTHPGLYEQANRHAPGLDRKGCVIKRKAPTPKPQSSSPEGPPRVERDGKVAVIYAAGTSGAGWSVWAKQIGIDPATLLHHPLLVGLVLAGDKSADDFRRAFHDLGFPEAAAILVYNRDDLAVMWVQKGSLIRIREEDGYEHVEIFDPGDWTKTNPQARKKPLRPRRRRPRLLPPFSPLPGGEQEAHSAPPGVAAESGGTQPRR
jgi:hypothetical protein